MSHESNCEGLIVFFKKIPPQPKINPPLDLKSPQSTKNNARRIEKQNPRPKQKINSPCEVIGDQPNHNSDDTRSPPHSKQSDATLSQVAGVATAWIKMTRP